MPYIHRRDADTKDEPSSGGWWEMARLLLIYFILQVILSLTGLQQRFDDWAIRKGMEFRERRRQRREKREQERLGLESSTGASRTDELSGGSGIVSGAPLYGTTETRTVDVADAPSGMELSSMRLELEGQDKAHDLHSKPPEDTHHKPAEGA